MESNKWIVSTDSLRPLPSFLAACLMLLSGCSNGHEARMEKLRSDHQNKYEQELADQRDSLRMADSALLEITPIINDMIAQGGFEYVKNEYDELGRFEVKGTSSDAHLGQSYLHASVNEYGICQLISEYRGASALNHTQILVKASDGTQQTSQTVSLDREGANYRFQNQGTYHETVTFVSDSVLAYIDLHASDKSLTVVQMGANGRKNTFSIQSSEIRQLSNSYRLGRALAIQLRSSQTSKVAAQKIQLLEVKLQNNDHK